MFSYPDCISELEIIIMRAAFLQNDVLRAVMVIRPETFSDVASRVT